MNTTSVITTRCRLGKLSLFYYDFFSFKTLFIGNNLSRLLAEFRKKKLDISQKEMLLNLHVDSKNNNRFI